MSKEEADYGCEDMAGGNCGSGRVCLYAAEAECCRGACRMGANGMLGLREGMLGNAISKNCKGVRRGCIMHGVRFKEGGKGKWAMI